MTLRVQVWDTVDALGPEWDELFAAGPDIQCSRAWFRASAAAALPPGTAARFVGVLDGDRPAGLVPMRLGPGSDWCSLTTPYTCLFQPLLRPDAGDRLARRVGVAFGRIARRWPVTRLEAMDASWPDMAGFRSGLAAAGLVSASFAHFGNWYAKVPDGSWQGYLAERPSELRETIRRRSRAVGRDPALRLELVRDPAALAPALTAYEAVYARSWKEPEPFPAFNRALFAGLGPSGTLRAALMWSGQTPIAAQYWTIFRRRATVLKLAHDEAARSVSPGTVLTAYVIRSLIEQDGAEEIDFGRGDDAYKRNWAHGRRQRAGLIAFNPLRVQGALGLARQAAGELVRTAQNLLGHSGLRRDT